MALLRHNTECRDLLEHAFGPGDWVARAARTLGFTIGTLREIYGGRRRLSKRHYRIIAIYAEQRRHGRKSILDRELARVRREHDAAARAWHKAELLARAKEAEFARQGHRS